MASTSGGGFAASGLLQGFAQAYNAARIRATTQDLEQRHMLAGTLMQLYPNARPEAQADIAQRMLQIYSTPPGKKIDKGLSDISTLGRAATQQNMGAAAGAAGAPQPTGGMPPPSGPPPMPDVNGTPAAGAGEPPQVGGPQGAPPPPPSSPIPPPPDLAQSGAAYSPILSPEERNRQAAATITATEGAKVSAELDARKKLSDAMGLTGTQRENFIAGRMLTPFSHWQQKNYVDPAHPGQPMTGFFDPITHQVIDSDGNPLDNPQPWVTAVASPATPFRATLQANRSQGISDQQTLNDWNTRNSTIKGIRMVQQPDGSIMAVPVETATTTQSHGMLPTPPGTPQPKKVGGGAGAGPPGRVVGGKIPAEVDKAQTAYQQSVSRYNVMADALPKALAGDQQAMINLLYNHIGMTIGLQKGARITKDIIEEAQHSAPWMATLLARIGIGNEFTMEPDLLRGVVIPGETMENMVSLAENRLQQDYRSFVDTRDYHAKGGSQLPAPPSDVVNTAKGRNAKPGTTPPPPKAASDTVTVISHGTRGTIPKANLEQAKKLDPQLQVVQ